MSFQCISCVDTDAQKLGKVMGTHRLNAILRRQKSEPESRLVWDFPVEFRRKDEVRKQINSTHKDL